MTEQNASPGPVGKAKKRPNKAREQARKDFDTTAPLMPLSEFFTNWSSIGRGNLEIELNSDYQERIAADHVEVASTFAHRHLDDPVDDHELANTTMTAICLGVSQKLQKATPDSIKFETDAIGDINKTPVYLPKAAQIAIGCLGKTDVGDFVVRHKFGAQELGRAIVKTLKYATKAHILSDPLDVPIEWPPNYPRQPNEEVDWTKVDINNTVLPCAGSAVWLREESRKFMDSAYQNTWPVTDADGHDYEVSYPYLKIDPDDLRGQRDRVATWLDRLNVNMPDVNIVAAAGIMTAWRLDWFSLNNWNTVFPDAPAWVPQPAACLALLRVWKLDWWQIAAPINTVTTWFSRNASILASFLDVSEHKPTDFGNDAQLLVVDEKRMTVRTMRGIDNVIYREVDRGAEGIAVRQGTNKGTVVEGMMFAFARKVEVHGAYGAVINGTPSSVRTSFMKTDFKHIVSR